MQLKELNVENVSPTLGNDQLRAGIVAGLIGLALVAIYMLVFYRLLGLVVIAGLILTGMALYTLVAWILPESFGLTIVLSLAGVTGIIVSVGVTVDSYVVYFERIEGRGARRAPRCAPASTARSRGRSARSSPPTSCRSSARPCSTRSPSGRCAASRSSSGSRPSSTCSWREVQRNLKWRSSASLRWGVLMPNVSSRPG